MVLKNIGVFLLLSSAIDLDSKIMNTINRSGNTGRVLRQANPVLSYTP